MFADMNGADAWSQNSAPPSFVASFPVKRFPSSKGAAARHAIAPPEIDAAFEMKSLFVMDAEEVPVQLATPP